MKKEKLFRWIDEEKENLNNLAKDIWKNPELGLQEENSSNLLSEYLKEKGFKIEKNIGGMPTSFIASYGNGSPKIGMLGEYDALPELSQKVKPEREPIKKGAPGHGCGHNLLGVGSLGGAIVIKKALDENGLDGSIIYYGCPAEEQVIGKVFMAREKVFDKLDACLTWHPYWLNFPSLSSFLALDNIVFEYEGKSSHAADSPESGRSALDAVQLMNISTEFMREHIIDEARVHYSILKGGGTPNVVPSDSAVWYYLRAPSRADVENITSWLRDIGEGASKMTRTSVIENFITGTHSLLPNETLGNLINKNMKSVDPIEYDEEEKRLASEIRKTIDKENVKNRMKEGAPKEISDHDLYPYPLNSFDQGEIKKASTDVSEVSRIAPLGQFMGATWVVGTPNHSWQATAASGSSIGTKGMIYASKVLAGTAYDLLTDHSKIEKAKKEFEKAKKGEKYETPLPPELSSPSNIPDKFMNWDS